MSTTNFKKAESKNLELDIDNTANAPADYAEVRNNPRTGVAGAQAGGQEVRSICHVSSPLPTVH